MGLSDEERLSGMYYACNEIYKRSCEIINLSRRDYCATEVMRVAKLGKNIWGAFLGSNVNSLHWIMGGSAVNQITAPDSSWSAAVLGGLQKDDECSSNDFDPLDMLGISDILQDSYCGKEKAVAYDLFAWTEQAAYSLRRYDDPFLRKHKKLSNLIAEIQGACFDVFRNNRDFGMAYLMHEIFEIMYASKTFREIATKQHWNHSLKRPIKNCDTAQILSYHKRVFANQKDDQVLLEVAFSMMGRSYHYDHEWEGFKKWAKNRFNIRILRSLFLKNQQQRKESKDENGTEAQRELEFYPRLIHGYDSGAVFADCQEKENRAKKSGKKKNDLQGGD